MEYAVEMAQIIQKYMLLSVAPTGVEMPVSLPTHVVARTLPGGETNAKLFSLAELSSDIMLQTLEAMQRDGVQRAHIIRALEAYAQHDVRVWMDREPAACECILDMKRFVWMRSDLSRDLFTDLIL